MPGRSGAVGARRPLLRAVAPPADARLGVWTLESTADLRMLRAELRAVLHRAYLAHLAGHVGAPRAPRTSPAVLVASELATNALRHGIPPVVVVLSRCGGAELLDVVDGSVDTVPTFAARRPIGEGGIGLHLVGRLADDVGWYAQGGRKHVWALLRG
ncbi:MAG: ATP-binding protein [Micrococcales bacterium]|nr:ATP-binding protein [Micrococcales bacterium]